MLSKISQKFPINLVLLKATPTLHNLPFEAIKEYEACQLEHPSTLHSLFSNVVSGVNLKLESRVDKHKLKDKRWTKKRLKVNKTHKRVFSSESNLAKNEWPNKLIFYDFIFTWLKFLIECDILFKPVGRSLARSCDSFF